MESCVFCFYLPNMISIWICKFQRATQESYKGKGYNWPKKKRKRGVVMSTTLNTCIYIRTNTVTHMFTYIRNRICFSFHLKFPFFISMKVICWGRFPFIKFICRIFDTIVTKDHRQGWGGGGGGHPDPEIRGGKVEKFFFDLSGLSLVQK